MQIDCNFGNWAILTAVKNISLVGNVVNNNSNVALYTGAGESSGGKTLLGLTYPTAQALANTTLISNGALAGDLIQFKVSPANEAYVSAIVIGSDWVNAANPSDALDSRIATLTIPNGYIYVRNNNNAGFTWQRVKPN